MEGGVDERTQINGWFAVLAILAIQQWWIESQQVETYGTRRSSGYSSRG